MTHITVDLEITDSDRMKYIMGILRYRELEDCDGDPFQNEFAINVTTPLRVSFIDHVDEQIVLGRFENERKKAAV